MMLKNKTPQPGSLYDFQKPTGGLKLLVYGAPGSGKTRFAYSASLDERSSPVLGIDAFGNPESVRAYASLPDIVQIQQIKDLNDPYDWLVNGQPPNHPFAERFGIGGTTYKTIVLDTITDIQRYAFNEAIGQPNSPGTFARKREWDDFNKVLGQMIKMATLFYGLADTHNLNIIMTAHEKKKEDRMTGMDQFQPLLDGQSDQEVPGKALMVARMMHISRLSASQRRDIKDARTEAADSTIAAFVKPTSSYAAKDQYGTGMDFFLDPTITTVLDAIESGGA